jgi:glucose/arabinose dehydrogenase
VGWLVVAAMAALPGAGLEAQAAPDTVVSQRATFRVETVMTGLQAPVSLAFLPNGTAILAERAAGTFSVVDLESGRREPITGLDGVVVDGDGGTLDVILDPDFADNGWLYLVYTATAAEGSATALDRARLEDGRFVERERLFTSSSALETAHFGGRVAFADGHLFLTIGDRQPRRLPDRMEAQSLASHRGTIVRIRPDGSVPDDNPFTAMEGALPEIWSYGHRNPQGLVVHPRSGALWEHEHGPQGGDEINLVQAGRNFGWPLVTYGEEYGGGPVAQGRTHHPGTTQPIYVYRPSIAPSDMAFVSGRAFPEWEGNLLVGALGQEHLNRLTLDGDRVLHEERLLEGRGWRIRMVEEGPDGRIYLGTDSGLLVRLSPARSAGQTVR